MLLDNLFSNNQYIRTCITVGTEWPLSCMSYMSGSSRTMPNIFFPASIHTEQQIKQSILSVICCHQHKNRLILTSNHLHNNCHHVYQYWGDGFTLYSVYMHFRCVCQHQWQPGSFCFTSTPKKPRRLSIQCCCLPCASTGKSSL